MLRRNKRDRPALIVLGLLVASILGVAALGLVSRYAANYPAYRASQYASQASNPDAAAVASAIMDFNPWDDTFAQWVMAFAGLIATVASVWALFYLRRTLHETRRIGQAQVRAYLSIASGTYSIYSGILILKADVRNTGSSPSRSGTLNWRVEHIGFETQAGQITKINRVSRAEDTPFASVQAEGSVGDVEVRFSTDDGIGNDLFDRRIPFVVKGALQWTDVFGVVCHEPFSLVSRRDHGYVKAEKGDPPDSVGILSPIPVS